MTDSITPWAFNNKPFTPEDIGKHTHFVYHLTDKLTGKQYIGMKSFTSTRTLPPLKGQKRKRKVTKESDWQTYCSSSPEIKAIVSKDGLQRFERTILYLCQSKSEAAYLELAEQVRRDAIRSSEYYNDLIMIRIHRKHLPKTSVA